MRQPQPKKSRLSPSPALKPAPSQPSRVSPRRPVKVPEEEEEEPEVPGPDPEQDIAEAKEDVARLKAEQLVALAHKEAAAALGNADVLATPSSNGKKRNIEETATPPFKLDLAKVQAAAGDAMDIVATRPVINRRRLANLPPSQKAAAWGGFVFLLGLGASAIFPSLLPGGPFW